MLMLHRICGSNVIAFTLDYDGEWYSGDENQSSINFLQHGSIEQEFTNTIHHDGQCQIGEEYKEQSVLELDWKRRPN